jgi:hypothetical protein
MIVLIAAAAWIFALTVVAALCLAARRGDRAEYEDRARAASARTAMASAPPAPAASAAPLQRAA